MEPLLVSIPTASRILDLGRSTVYALVASGKLRTVQIGRSRRIPLDALRDFVAALEAEQGAREEAAQ